MASSSGTFSASVILPKEKYDVFISFRGTDTRKTFTSHLHAALIRRKVETYIDYRLERGDEVGPALLKSIKESKISVIIFSENYADSTWCLDELAHILECKETHGRHVIPVFYEVEPSHIRYQTGSYKTAFDKHEQRLTVKVPMWKEALVKAANLSGFDSTSKTVRHDSDLVDQVVAEVLAKLNRESSTDLTGLIGAEGRIQKILLKLDMVLDDLRVRFLVLWGMGGVGKTTLADAVYHGLSSNFESHCFLANVRELSGTKGAFSPELYTLRDKLLRKLLGDSSLTIDTPTIDAYQKERLRRTKVLVVLDDVNDSSQLTFLAEEVPFGPGSRIIITTRDVQPVKETLVLNEVADRDVKIHEVEKLNGVESLQLFFLNQPNARTHWTDNSKSLQRRVLDYADGIPLALKILRPLFVRCKGKEEQLWASLKEFPNKSLQNVYRASYDGLEENEKEIFLDIACFHKMKKLRKAKRIIAACGLFPDNGIEILVDMSLISIREDRIWMHDVIQEMGCKIVHEECDEDPGRRSRLYTLKDVRYVLENNKGTAAVKGISLNMAWNDRNVMLTGEAFTGMDNLRFLDFGSDFYTKVNVNKDLERLPNALKFLSWFGCPLKSLPSNFSPENLVELHVQRSRLQGLWNQGQRRPKNLRRIDLSRSSYLTEVPDLSNCVYIESINLEGCDALTHIPSYFRNLTKLTYLYLRGCSKVRKVPELPPKMKLLYLDWSRLEELPSSIWSIENLHELSLGGYKGNIPNVTWNLRSVTSLDLTSTHVESVPSSIENLSKVVSVELRECQSLVSLPTTICKLKSLERLDLCGCTRLEMFPEIEEPMERLEYLSLQETGIEQLHPSIGNLVGLKTLDLTRCNRLELVPSGIYKLKHLKRLDLCGCTRLEMFPEIEEPMERLEYLSLRETGIEQLPPSIGNLVGLKTLDLTRCNRLELVPSGIYKLKHLKRLDLCGCTRLEMFPEIEEPMERLEYLSLQATGIEQLTPSIGNLVGLKTLDLTWCDRLELVPSGIYKLKHLENFLLGYCRRLTNLPVSSTSLSSLVNLGLAGCNLLKAIPERLISSPSLQSLNLCGNWTLAAIPESIIFSGLTSLNIKYCKRLRSLPELPYHLKELIADGCTALEEVPRTAWNKEGWPEYRDGYMNHTFCNCLNLDDNARSNIMEDALIRIMRSANYARSRIMEDAEIRSTIARSAPNIYDTLRQASAITMWPGNEIPRWFSCQTEGSIINIKLPMCSNLGNVLGVALCVVVTIHEASYLRNSCKSIFTTNRGGERRLVKTVFEKMYWVSAAAAEISDHILVWYNPYEDKEVSWSTEASFDFYIDPSITVGSNIKQSNLIEVKRCGVSFVYAEGHDDGLKFEVVHPQQGDDNL